MPLPTAGDVHVNAPLTNISIAYTQDDMNFVADKVFPIVPVQNQSDRYYVYDRSYWFRSEAQIRAPGTETAGGGYAIDNTPTYHCPVIGIHKDVDDQIRANADPMVNMDRDATEYVTQQMLLKREIDFGTNFFTTGIWTGSTTGADIVPGTKWSASGGTPFVDIKAQMKNIKKLTGRSPNVLVLGEDVETGLSDSADILDRIKYTQRVVGPGGINMPLLAALWGLDRVVVAGATNNTAKEGQTASYSFLHNTKDALLCYANPRPSLLQPSAGYIFSWTGYLGAGPQGQRIKRYRMEPLASDRIEGEIAFGNKLVASELGVYFDGAVA